MVPGSGRRTMEAWPGEKLCNCIGMRELAMISLFPRGEKCQRMRGDDGGGEAGAGAGKGVAFGPPHPALCATFSPRGRRQDSRKPHAIALRKMRLALSRRREGGDHGQFGVFGLSPQTHHPLGFTQASRHPKRHGSCWCRKRCCGSALGHSDRAASRGGSTGTRRRDR